MTGVLTMLRTLDPRERRAHDDRLRAAAASAKALRGQVRDVRHEMAGLMARLDALRRDLSRARALQQHAQDAPAMLDRLADVLDDADAAGHVRRAAARAVLVESPGLHLTIDDVLPRALYDLAVEAVPSPVFFPDGGRDRQTVRVPPRMAPVQTIATWTCVADVVATALVPALVERFSAQLVARRDAGAPRLRADDQVPRLGAEPGRLVRRLPGLGPPGGGPAWAWLTIVIHLARPGEDDAFGSLIHRRADAPARDTVGGTDPVRVPVRANTALAVFDWTGTHTYEPIPPDAPAGTSRCSYEVHIGPDRSTRPATSHGTAMDGHGGASDT